MIVCYNVYPLAAPPSSAIPQHQTSTQSHQGMYCSYLHSYIVHVYKLIPHTAIMIYIYIISGATFSDALRCNWCRIIDSIDDATAFANQLKQAGFIPRSVYNTAIDGRLGQTTKDRVTNLLASTEGAIKNRDKQHFVKLCEIVREVGDSVVADKLLHEANIASGRSKYNYHHTILGSTHTLPHHCS